MLRKSSEGITLIALIITIVVMLILAGVTINLTIGQNGIFKTAKQAARNYTDAQDKEFADLNSFENTIAGIIGNGAGGESNQAPTYETLSTKAKLGDYVKYTPTAKAFSMTPEQTGQDANQDFNTGDYKGLWQVLYNDAEHGLQIISADTVGNLTLGNDNDEVKAKLAYNNAVDTLNSFCSNYVDTRYASSGRCVGSNPKSPSDATTATEKLLFTYNGSTESGCKIADENYQVDENAMKVATNQSANGIHNLGKNYWYASRYVGTGSNDATFRVRYFEAVVGASDNLLWDVHLDGSSNPHSNTNGVRPVLSFKSDIQTNGGNGSGISPYELVAK